METNRMKETTGGCLGDIIKCHENGEDITFSYIPGNDKFMDLMKNDIENITYVEKKGKKYYFKKVVIDNSGWRDCDVRYTYTPIKYKPFYSREEILDGFEKEGIDFINKLK